MGIWLKANRTLAEIVAAGVLLLAIVGVWLYHDQRIATAATVKCENAVSTPQAVADLQEANHIQDLLITRLKAAQAKNDALNQITLRPVSGPIWLCDPRPVRARKTASAAGGQNPGASAGAGTIQPGSRYDAGPAVDRLKARYETVMAEARAAIAECPTVTVLPLEPMP